MALEDIIGRALHDDLTAVHDDGARRTQRFFHKVRDEEHGDALIAVEAGDDVDDLAAALGIEHRRRLVEDKHFGHDGKHACDRNALLLPARKTGDRRMAEFLHADRL